MTNNDDRLNQTCTKCGVGDYQETSIHDDWDGVLHCNNKKCNHEVKRYKSKDNPQPKVEEVKLSPKTQAVLDAYESTADKYKAIAAVIRALVNQGDSIYDRDGGELVGVVRDSVSFAIADELESK
jgi:hypothetical protein